MSDLLISYFNDTLDRQEITEEEHAEFLAEIERLKQPAAAPPAPTSDAPVKMHTMVSEFPDGILVGWDVCTVLNGGCGLNVTKCQCKGGPKEPKIFEAWRTGAKQIPSYNDPMRHVDPTAPKVSSKTTQKMQAAVADTATVVEEALGDPEILAARIRSLQSAADQELATNGKTARFEELTAKLTPLYDQQKNLVAKETPA